MATGTCYRCGQFGHFSKDCVSKGVAQKPLAPAWVYVLVPREPEGRSEVVTGNTPILGFEASILFDLGATLSLMFVRLSRLVVRTLKPSLVVTATVGKTVVCKRVVFECPVSICGRVLPANLVVLSMFSYDIILGIDWLIKHSAIIDYVLKQVTLTPWGEGKVTYVGSRARSLPPTLSVVQARKLIARGDQACFWHLLSLQQSKQGRIWKIFLWCASIQMSFRQTTLDYHHRGRWSLGLSVCKALILSLKHLIGWHCRS
jgi:hypothetical protein